jgi:hypothetical protein
MIRFSLSSSAYSAYSAVQYPGVTKPPTTRTTPKKLIPEKALLHGFHEFALIRVRTLLYPWFEFFHSRPFASLADNLSAGKPTPVPCPSAFTRRARARRGRSAVKLLPFPLTNSVLPHPCHPCHPWLNFFSSVLREESA